MEEHSLAFLKTQCKVLEQRHVSYLSASAKSGYNIITGLGRVSLLTN
jgi:hypothetical protein